MAKSKELKGLSGGFDPELFRRRLEYLMEVRGKTLSELAQAAGCDVATLWRYTKEGKGGLVPSLEKAFGLARALEVSLDELAGQQPTPDSKRFDPTPKRRIFFLRHLADEFHLPVTEGDDHRWLLVSVPGGTSSPSPAGDLMGELTDALLKVNQALDTFTGTVGGARAILHSDAFGAKDRTLIAGLHLYRAVEQFINSFGLTIPLPPEFTEEVNRQFIDSFGFSNLEVSNVDLQQLYEGLIGHVQSFMSKEKDLDERVGKVVESLLPLLVALGSFYKAKSLVEKLLVDEKAVDQIAQTALSVRESFGRVAELAAQLAQQGR